MRCLVLSAVLLLTGCSGSGFWRYQTDTFTFPWQNPNGPVSGGENFVRAQHGSKAVDTQQKQMLTEAGDIWPGPPRPVPTLKELQKQQLAEINSEGTTTTGTTMAPLPTLPSLPGYDISTQEQGNPAPTGLFTGGALALPGGRHITSNYGALGGGTPSAPPAQGTTRPNGDIVVPNGNGTSTVISPTGKVTTIPSGK